jgi:mannose-6-phosphate isomerase
MEVHAGDMLYVAAGTVHTIGGGMVLVETQQTSDITYRLYDYGRPRELHIAEGLAATQLHTNAGKVRRNPTDDGNVLVRSPFFQVEKFRLRDVVHAKVMPDSPHVIVAVDGSGVVESQGMEPISFATGDAVVVPARVRDYTLRPQWELEVMRMSLPTGAVEEPQTELPQSVSAP